MPKYSKRADGRYQVQVQIGISEDGKRKFKTVYGKTIKEVEAKAAQLKSEIEKNIFIDDKNITVEEWAKEWLELYKSGKEYKTTEMYQNVVNKHIIPVLGQYKLKDLKTVHIQKLINGLYNQGYTRIIQIIKLTINQILEQAIKSELIYKNVASGLEMPVIKKTKKRSLTQLEKDLLKHCDLDLKTKSFVYTLLYTGLRHGEILALTQNDINLDANIISVNKTIVNEGSSAVIKPCPKSEAGYRNVPIVAELKQLLIEYLPTVNSIYVFPNTKGEIMTRSSFRKFWARFIKILNESAGGNNNIKAIADDITPHLFRHPYVKHTLIKFTNYSQIHFLNQTTWQTLLRLPGIFYCATKSATFHLISTLLPG